MVPPHAHMGRPGYGLAANLAHFYYVMKKLGITKKALGVTAHGLRHGCANDHHEALTGNKTPVRGGRPLPAEQERVARESTARLLGHSRPDITGAYIGSARSRNATSANECDDDATGSKNGNDTQSKQE
jgi:integrase